MVWDFLLAMIHAFYTDMCVVKHVDMRASGMNKLDYLALKVSYPALEYFPKVKLTYASLASHHQVIMGVETAHENGKIMVSTKKT